MNVRIDAARSVCAQADLELARVVADVQMKCKHERCAEASYIPSEYGNSIVPLGICLDCGMTEDGWATYYGLAGLHGKHSGVTQIDRRELYRMRAGLHLDGAKKTLLCRREASLCTLVAAWLTARGAS